MSVQKSSLVRFFLTLPEPFPVPDGHVFHGVPGTYDENTPPQLVVHLRFLQSQETSRRYGSFAAAVTATRRLRASSGADAEESYGELRGQYTTVVATTLEIDFNNQGDSWESPQDVPGERDALNRCLLVTSEIIRSYRVAYGISCLVPTYELLNFAVPFQKAAEIVVTEDGVDGFHFDDADWGEVGILTLDHFNLPDVPQGDEIDVRDGRVGYFGELLNMKSPLFFWLERFVEARRAFAVEGQYGAAVTLSNTASEVLLDSLLASLYWEVGKTPEDVATIFTEGRLAKRVKTHFSELLGGEWVLDGSGPVADWFHKCYKVRHRVVHGGYSPTRLEAKAALDSVLALSDYCWDRIATNRKKFPRIAMMTLSKDGLVARGKWCNFMKKFAAEVAPNEDSWLRQSDAWRNAVYAILMADEQ
ncbi:hypothetical protein [Streptomyces avermitilis]|uniref:hypothetical protein n=1 Tax=Streptomyces avermitilis TaxID=33903 RepID=UPI00367E3ECF